jgi:uncharacterized membrane protein
MPRWLIPTSYVLVSLFAAQIIPRIEYALAPGSGNIISVSSAQALLGAASSGMMAFTAIVFSVALLFIQYTSTTYSKRYVLLLSRRPVVYHVFGVFVATFIFALSTLAFVDRNGSAWVPFGSIAVVGALLLISIALLAWLIRQVSELRVTRMLANIGDAGRASIRLKPLSQEASQRPQAPLGAPMQVIRYSGELSVVAAIDKSRLMRLAQEKGAIIRLKCAIGDTVFPRIIIARVYGARAFVDEFAVHQALSLAPEHSFEGDVRFPLRLLVDAAIMALSPAVNDPTTAVEAIDQIEDLLLRLGRQQLDTGFVSDESGNLRVVYPTPTWEDYLTLAFDEIRRYGGESLQIVRRIRAALVDLWNTLEDESRRDSVLRYRARLDAEIERRGFDETDRTTAFGVDPQGLGLTRRGEYDPG